MTLKDLTPTMNTKSYYDELEDVELIETPTKKEHHLRHSRPGYTKKMALPVSQFIQAQDDSRESFKFTYKAARFEAGWLLNSLGGFYEHGWISDVLRHVKGGKEASVYLCRAGTEVDAALVAAKVYRPRSLRNLKNDHAYREGRDNLDSEGKIVLNDGMQHAMAKRTEYGKGLLHQSWIAYEFTSMKVLKPAGADVPTPYEMNGNAILMGYIGDINGCAPTLSEISLERSEAHELFERVLHNIDLMLANERIHGDLSAYNILFWEGEITLIDFPQVVSPRINRNAFSIFQRDVTRVCEYFNKQGLRTDPRKIGADLWKKHGYKPEPEVDIRLLDAEDPKDRALWQKQGRRK
jgi:RIO kinase 1